MKPIDSRTDDSNPAGTAAVTHSPWRNGNSTWPYPALDFVSLEISGFPRFPVRSRRNH